MSSLGLRNQGQVRGSTFGVRFQVRNAIDEIEMEAKDAFVEVVASLLDAANAQFDLRATAIETFEPLQHFRAKLFEAKHRAATQQGRCPGPEADLPRILVTCARSIAAAAYVPL